MLIKTENLGKTYHLGPVDVEALKNVNLEIDEGEFVAIIGASGSGKSTLLNLIGALDTPTSGTYYLNGTKIDDTVNLAKIRREQIGFVFQTFNLIPQLTAQQNVEVPLIYAGLEADARKSRSRELLEEVGLADRVHHRPNELSGGQKQRVAIARALANRPKIILADEPTGNLDSKTAGKIMKYLEGLNNQGTTILLITHEEDIAQSARRTIRLHDGEVVT